MRKLYKRSFEELVKENKNQLMKDQNELERIELAIEQRLEKRMLERAE
ncbi:FbpB family small basic protein [Priestia megaterium]|nr:FbpB family small basic protein [Priestia megaterium]